MVALAAGGLLSGYPGWVKDHALYLWAAIGVGILLFVWGKLLDRRESNTAQVQTTHGDRSPIGGSGKHSTTAGGDVRQVVAHNYYEAAGKAVPPPATQENTPKLDLSIPELKIEAEWMSLVYETHPGLWRKAVPSDTSPRKSFVVYVTRNQPPKGHKTKGSMSLVAILNFTYSLGNEQVSRAYWLGRNYNEVWFEAGHQEVAVVACCEGPFFSAYVNRFSNDGVNGFSPVIRGLGDRKPMPTVGPIVVKISIFDTNARMTVEEKQFELSISGSTATASEVK